MFQTRTLLPVIGENAVEYLPAFLIRMGQFEWLEMDLAIERLRTGSNPVISKI